MVARRSKRAVSLPVTTIVRRRALDLWHVGVGVGALWRVSGFLADEAFADGFSGGWDAVYVVPVGGEADDVVVVVGKVAVSFPVAAVVGRGAFNFGDVGVRVCCGWRWSLFLGWCGSHGGGEGGIVGAVVRDQRSSGVEDLALGGGGALAVRCSDARTAMVDAEDGSSERGFSGGWLV